MVKFRVMETTLLELMTRDKLKLESIQRLADHLPDMDDAQRLKSYLPIPIGQGTGKLNCLIYIFCFFPLFWCHLRPNYHT